MTTRASLLELGNLPTYKFDIDSYDQDKLGLGKLMIQKSGVAPVDNFAGPFPNEVMRPMEGSVSIAVAYPWAMQWSYSATSRKDWIFAAENSTAAATRRLVMWEFDRITGQSSYVGFLTITFPGTSEAKTIRSMRISYELETTGTVTVSGTAVTGSGTTWKTNSVCVGNRIGFGSTNPAAITTWYEISAIASDGALTLASSAGTIAAGTPFVIEDLRAYVIVTSVTLALGGLYIVKGLNRGKFTPTGTTIPAATTVDNISACYFLKDAATGTLTVAFGAGLEEKTSRQNRSLWVLSVLANPVMYKFNIYAPLVLTAGADTSAFKLKTGPGGALTGTTSQANNGRIANPQHGPGMGLDCIYFTTTTRVYRTEALSTIVADSTTWIADVMTEVPPGGTQTFAATSGLQSIEYSGTIDKFIISGNGTSGNRSYMTQYRTDGGQFDRILFVDYKQVDSGSADSSTTPVPSQLGSSFSCWVESGMLYAIRNTTTATTNQLYMIPLGADWEYIAQSGARLVLPRIPTPDAVQYLNAFVNAVQVVGGATGKNLGLQPEPYRLQFRTSGIDDNTGGWTPIDDTNKISGVAGAPYIQFRVEFRMGNILLPARLLNFCVTYQDAGMSDKWQGSVNVGTSLTAKQFGFRHAIPYIGNVPRLRADIYDAESGALLGTDDSETQAWAWAKSTNAGSSWTAYNSNNRTNSDTYVRVTPTSLADNIKVRAVLREY